MSTLKPLTIIDTSHATTYKPHDFDISHITNPPHNASFKTHVRHTLAMILRLMQQKGSWQPFQRNELCKLYLKDSILPEKAFYGLFKMESHFKNVKPTAHDLVLMRGDDKYVITNKFLEKCERAFPKIKAIPV